MEQTHIERKTPEGKTHRFWCKKRERFKSMLSVAFYKKDFVKVTEIHQTLVSSSV